jgi:hypothetical protein
MYEIHNEDCNSSSRSERVVTTEFLAGNRWPDWPKLSVSGQRKDSNGYLQRIPCCMAASDKGRKKRRRPDETRYSRAILGCSGGMAAVGTCLLNRL